MFTAYQDFNLRKIDITSIWFFYKCYNLSVAFLGIEDKDFKQKNNAFSNLLSAIIKKDLYEKSKQIQILNNFIFKDVSVINKMMTDVSEINISDTSIQNNLWRSKLVGLPTYDLD